MRTAAAGEARRGGLPSAARQRVAGLRPAYGAGLGARPGFIDVKSTAGVDKAVEGSDGGLRLPGGAHLHEAKAFAAARVAILNN